MQKKLKDHKIGIFGELNITLIHYSNKSKVDWTLVQNTAKAIAIKVSKECVR